MFCTQCGKQIDDTAKFCTACGAANITVQNVVVPQIKQNIQQQNVYAGNNSLAAKKGIIDNFVYVFKSSLCSAGTKGRISRGVFWQYTLIRVLITFIIAIPFIIADTSESTDDIVTTILNGAFFVPDVSSYVRRLHDVGKSGAYLLMPLVCLLPLLIALLSKGRLDRDSVFIVGISLMVIVGLYFLYLFVKPSDKGDNKYGAEPLS